MFLPGGGGGGGALPSNRLMGMCRWMGSHFHDLSDYNGVAFSIELLEWDRKFSGLGIRTSGQVGSLDVKKRTNRGTKLRVKYVFYIRFNKCVNLFYNDIVKRIYKVDS